MFGECGFLKTKCGGSLHCAMDDKTVHRFGRDDGIWGMLDLGCDADVEAMECTGEDVNVCLLDYKGLVQLVGSSEGKNDVQDCSSELLTMRP